MIIGCQDMGIVALVERRSWIGHFYAATTIWVVNRDILRSMPSMPYFAQIDASKWRNCFYMPCMSFFAHIDALNMEELRSELYWIQISLLWKSGCVYHSRNMHFQEPSKLDMPSYLICAKSKGIFRINLSLLVDSCTVWEQNQGYMKLSRGTML